MNRICLFVLFSLLVLNSSCSTPHSKSSQSDIIEIDILAAMKDQRPFPLSRIVDDMEIVPLENSIDSYFVNALSTVIGKQHILLACDFQNKVYLFNRNGSFVRNIGWLGEGPGEFLSLSYCIFDAKQEHIIILDQKGQKLIKYSVENEFIKEIKLPRNLERRIYDRLCEIDENRFALIVRRPMVPVNDFYSIEVFDFDLNHAGSQLPRVNNDSLCLPMLSYHEFTRGSSGTLFYEAVFDTVYRISSTGRARPLYHLKISDNHLKLEDFRLRSQVPWKSRAMVWGVYELKNFLFIPASDCMNPFLVVYDKKTKETYSVSQTVNCATGKFSLENDIYGLEPVRLYFAQPKDGLNTFFFRPQVDIAQKEIDINCLRKQPVSRPDLRDKLADMMDSMTGDENAVLLIMHLK
ncbi:MAG: 6-bladed beta-propeller [Bacteroidia bacterium]|nr:6-bladed beta-propeller [Bacteroidia bacterium]